MSAQVVPLRPTYGATADEWAQFALVVGVADLLPVVSRPGAVISPQSTMKGLGKTPSQYNGNRQVVGIPKWTGVMATDAQVARWAQESDYGLCIQTRRVRGLDIDVADPDLSARIAAAFLEALGVQIELPVRSRTGGTGKQLLAFELVGQFAKRSFKVDGGLVEFLGNGQQFIAIGEHFDGAGQPTGTRYDWGEGIPAGFPRITQAQFEAAWARIVELFAAEPASEGGVSAARDRADIAGLQDPVAEYLDEQGLVVGAQGEKLFVECPWKSGHTADSGVSETCWLVAGSRGFERGHFQCMHASCAKREDVEFLDAIGFRIAAFGDLSGGEKNELGDDAEPSGAALNPPDPTVDLPWPKFKRDKNGRIEATLDNVQRALACPPMVEITIRFDAFRDELMVQRGGGANGGPVWYEPFTDADAVATRIALEQRGFKPVGREMFRDALMVHARDNTFDSAQDWLQGLPEWDGVERVETCMSTFFATEDTPYTRAVGRYLWTALAGRVMRPGCKVDMVLILQGIQGALKSTAVAALAPEGTFRELNLHDLGPNLSRRLRGCIVGELAELRGLRSKDAESIKAWIVQQEERWVPKYVEREIAFPRRTVLVATTNPAEVLDDETGERRWLPAACLGRLNIAGLTAARDQLWAEGLLRWSLMGVEWQDAERLARAEHKAFKVQDPLESRVVRWLEGASDVSGISYHKRGWLLMADLLDGVSGAGAERLTNHRAGKILRGLGWKSQGLRVEGQALWAWVRQGVRDL